MIELRVPATSANLGPGFDSLGVALTLYNRVWMEEGDGPRISTTDGSRVPLGGDNLVYRSARLLYGLCGRPFRGLMLRQENHIPMARGLGSSSACVAAGLCGANALLGNPLSRDDLLSAAARLEGHPDNSTPALLGGLTVAAADGGRVRWAKVPVPDGIRFAAFIPDFELKTVESRAALPSEVSRADAVFNLSRAALLVASLAGGRLENLDAAVRDRIHQPYRVERIPGAADIFALCGRIGALGTYLSGSGPTVMAFVSAGDGRFEPAARAALGRMKGWSLRMLGCDPDGVTVGPTQQEKEREHHS